MLMCLCLCIYVYVFMVRLAKVGNVCMAVILAVSVHVGPMAISFVLV